jgi:hypothetical protein
MAATRTISQRLSCVWRGVCAMELSRISFSDDIGVAGIILAVILVVLDKAGKLKGAWLIGLLSVAGAMTLFLALGNSWVLDAPIKWKIWRGILTVTLVGLSYSGVAIWILDGAREAETKNMAATAPCDLAGNTVSASVPKIPLSETTSSQSKAWERWLSHVRDLPGYTQPTIYSYGKGISYEDGKIDNPAKQSALVCIKCRGTTYG